MQLRLLEKEKNTLRIEISNPDDTVVYPLLTALLKNEDIADARYFTGHPQLDKPVLTIVTKKGNPQAVLRKVAEGLASEFASAKAIIEKELS
jgi:DNA-directed RNA polymerase subunit L